jgi:hypothetical protein
MIDRDAWWSPTGGLYAIAAAIAAVAIVIGVSASPPRRYEFSASALGVWRGDTITGEAVLCVSSAEAHSADDDRSPYSTMKGIVKKC